MSARVKEVKNKIVLERNRIWLEEPEDLKRLINLKLPPCGTFAPIEHAFGETKALAFFLFDIREMVRMGEIPIDYLKTVTKRIVERYRDRFRNWELNETIKLLDEFLSVLDEIRTINEFVDIVDEVIIYLSRLNYWIDIKIPWIEINKTFYS